MVWADVNDNGCKGRPAEGGPAMYAARPSNCPLRWRFGDAPEQVPDLTRCRFLILLSDQNKTVGVILAFQVTKLREYESAGMDHEPREYSDVSPPPYISQNPSQVASSTACSESTSTIYMTAPSWNGQPSGDIVDTTSLVDRKVNLWNIASTSSEASTSARQAVNVSNDSSM